MEPRASKTDPAYQYHLRRYFSSGWAFLIPYLVAYLLYYVTKWPVNAVAESNQETVIGNQYTWAPCLLHVYWAIHAIHLILAGFALWSWWKRPKGSDVGGSSLAMSDPVSLEKETKDGTPSQTPPTSSPSVQTGLSPLTTAHCPLTTDHCSLTTDHCSLSTTPRSSLLLSLAPWALLALLFYIPGVYLEWPSDPWEHLRRINEWRILDTVGAHSSWHKSAYFIPYSMLSWCIGLRQLFWLDFYYNGICLLLCWQYYKLSRACGLGERASMVFVILQALLFGNNIFSFYRYYGISSSIYAQLGAIALTRIVLEFAARGTNLEPGYGHKKAQEDARTDAQSPEPLNAKNAKANLLTQRSRSKTSTLCDLGVIIGSIIRSISQKAAKITKEGNPVGPSLVDAPSDDPFRTQSAPPGDSLPTSDSRHLTSDLRPLASSIRPLTSGFWHPASVLCLLSSGICLLALTAFNHQQGLGIAALGIAAVIIWRLIEWKRSALWWLIGGTLLFNALFLWLYPRPAIIEIYRAQGYLNAWYGFNILNLSSPAGDRMLQILSIFGLVNLSGTFFLLRRNHVIAWLTTTPFLFLLLPCISIPFGYALSKHGDLSNIVTFQRLLFGIPSGLVLIQLFDVRFGAKIGRQRIAPQQTSLAEKRLFTQPTVLLAFIVVVSVATGFLLLSPAYPHYNRFWNTISHTPRDLTLASYFEVIDDSQQAQNTIGSLHLMPLVGNAVQETLALKSTQGSITARGYEGLSTRNIEKIIRPLPLASAANRLTPHSGDTAMFDLLHIQTKSAASAAPNLNKEWVTLAGTDAMLVPCKDDLHLECVVARNPDGSPSYVFSDQMMPVDQHLNYEASISVVQLCGPPSVTYCSVVWYDEHKQILVSNDTSKTGASYPLGWHNGTYSYFGLVGESPSLQWKTFIVVFGPGMKFEIPRNARFARTGTILNYQGLANVVCAAKHAYIREVALPKMILAIGRPCILTSFRSTAGRLSQHWNPNSVSLQSAGSLEMLAAGIEWQSALKQK